MYESLQARLQRASTLLKIGKLDEASLDYTELVTHTHTHTENVTVYLTYAYNVHEQDVHSILATFRMMLKYTHTYNINVHAKYTNN